MMTGEDSAVASAQVLNIDDPRLFLNRELSLLAFQDRVLGEAKDCSNPLLERLNLQDELTPVSRYDRHRRQRRRLK